VNFTEDRINAVAVSTRLRNIAGVGVGVRVSESVTVYLALYRFYG